jgi:putative transposase
VKYAFVQNHLKQFSIAAMCRALKISRSGYYDWCTRPPSKRSQRDAELSSHIVHLHGKHRRALGALKTWHVLNAQGFECGKHRVARLRKTAGIEARRKQRFRVMVEHHHREPAVCDLVRREFDVQAPDQVWVGDMTTLRTREGWLHLAIVLDFYARRLVGWAMDAHQTAALPMAALSMPIIQRQPDPGLICHTDQGAQYCASTYRALLHKHRFKASMSRKGNCRDNAVAESFFSNLKNELTHHAIYQTRREAKATIFDYIELFYALQAVHFLRRPTGVQSSEVPLGDNRLRPHQTLGYRTPVEVEVQYSEMLD